MDKNYFDGSETGMSRSLRGLYSQLTNTLFAFQSGDASKAEVMLLVKEITQAQTEPREGYAWMESQLYACANYWEEPMRYDVCWPLLRQVLTSEAGT